MSSLDPDDLKQRAETLRLPVNELARLAGVNKDTLHNIFKGLTQPRLDTMRAISAALVAEERRVLNHLMTLHLLGEPHVRAHAEMIPPQLMEPRGPEMAGLA